MFQSSAMSVRDVLRAAEVDEDAARFMIELAGEFVEPQRVAKTTAPSPGNHGVQRKAGVPIARQQLFDLGCRGFRERHDARRPNLLRGACLG
jgi:hypothetical protein